MAYIKKERFENLRTYSPKLVAFASVPLLLIFLLVLTFLFYGNPIRSLYVFAFILLNIILLVPYLFFPIVNIFLLDIVNSYHLFLTNAVGISGDAFTLTISWFFAIIYTIASYFLFILILGATVLSVKDFSSQIQKKLLERIGFLSLIKPKKLQKKNKSL